MAIGVVMRFTGVTAEHYEAVMGKGPGIDVQSPRNPDAEGNWPEGLVAHLAGPTDDGWCVVDTWESGEALDAFVGGRLGPALGAAGVPQPDLTFFEVYNHLP
ncbi:MAG TPA: hypothetical protein VF640_07750 [Acidimicrobiales bacterium]|jgi:hypothetical protein